MLKKIESLIFTAGEFEKAVAFFEEILELPRPYSSENMARFELDGFPIFVARSDGNSSLITIETDDINADYVRLSDKGIEFKEPVKTLGGGDKAAFFDGPSGSEFMLYQPPPETE